MASYKERLQWLIDRKFVGIGATEEGEAPVRMVLYCGAVEITIPYGVKTVEEAIDIAIENGIGGASE